MINQLTVMLYVKNVHETAAFWQEYLGFTAESLDLGSSESIILSNGNEFAIQLFEEEFIKVVSPEVSFGTPSLMLQVEDLAKTHAKLQTSGKFVSEIGVHGFNFADNEDRYFACRQG